MFYNQNLNHAHAPNTVAFGVLPVTASSGLLLPEKTDGCPSEHIEAKTQRRRPDARLGKAILRALKKSSNFFKKNNKKTTLPLVSLSLHETAWFTSGEAKPRYSQSHDPPRKL